MYALDLPHFRGFINYFLFLNLLDTPLLFPFQRNLDAEAVCSGGSWQFPYCHSDTFAKLCSVRFLTILCRN